MAYYFDGRHQVSEPFAVEISKRKRVICSISKVWVDTHVNECRCGMKIPFKVTRTWGVSQKESQEFESAIESSLGAKAIAQLKGSIKATSSHEMELTYTQSEEMSYECDAPDCGCCVLRVSQMVYDYEFICYTKGFLFKKDAWDREWTRTLREALPWYSGIPDKQEYDARCKGCKEERSPAFDGRLSIDFGNLSLLVPYKVNLLGLVTQVGSKVVVICGPDELEGLSKRPYYPISLSRDMIHPALAFLGNLAPTVEVFEGRARIYRSFATHVRPKVEVPSLAKAIELDSSYLSP